MPKEFKFELNEPVCIAASGETGTVTGRAQYTNMPDQYQVRYVNNATCAVETWWEESTLVSNTCI